MMEFTIDSGHLKLSRRRQSPAATPKQLAAQMPAPSNTFDPTAVSVRLVVVNGERLNVTALKATFTAALVLRGWATESTKVKIDRTVLQGGGTYVAVEVLPKLSGARPRARRSTAGRHRIGAAA